MDNKINVLKFLNRLPEPYRSEALYNYELDPMGGGNPSNGIKGTSDALYYGFEWMKTPQGHGYWDQLRDDLENGKIKEVDRVEQYEIY